MNRLRWRSRKTEEEGLSPGQLALASDTTHRYSRHRYVIWSAVCLAFAFMAALAFLAWTNKARADDWEARAAELAATAERLDETLDDRTIELNERTEDLNDLAEKVTAAEEAISRSEADVKRLERRQRQLASEKANVEDARAALALQTAAIEGVASAYLDCTNGLTELLTHVLAENYGAATVIVGRVEADCSGAESSLDAYLATYS
jgi:septal ring factor EnvC (AmiA/AmiB activator)